MLDAIPSVEEIKQILFEMDPDISPGPDGFSGSFYRAYWMIIQDDVVNAVQFCWKRKFIPKGLNSNFPVLLPKVEGARSPQQYRPIGLSNVSFKIFTKIIASRMSGLMHKLVSPHQAAYIKGRKIQDQIILASKMVNEIWRFLFQVLKKYRFPDTWCKWLGIVFESARISVMINGGPNGFFPVGRGLRQGDPLSPLLFVLMEDVLSRNITKLVMEGKINPMVIRNGIHPSHMFFADDVFIFCNGAKKSIQNLMKILEAYQDSSGQVINKNKSKLFVDGTTAARVIQIKEMMQMEVSKLPDKYLGVILHAGRVKIATVWPMMEMMQNKNFLWSGDGDIKKFKTLSWKKVCSPYSEGGLGLQRLEILNKSLLMKILWRIINSEAEWALFIKAKFQDKQQQWKCNWQLSSIWPGLKGAWNHLKENIRWCLGNGQKNSLWYDSWLGNTPIIEEVGLTDYVKNHINLKVSDLILEGKWNVPEELKPIIAHYTLPEIGVGEDILVWKEDIKACAILKELWFQKNKMWFEQIKPNLQSFKARIKKTIYKGSLRMKSNKWNSDIDNQKVILVSDSKTVITEFENNKMPWFVRMRWQKEIKQIQNIQFLHSYRETNFAADTAAKKGAKLAAGQRKVYVGRPRFLARVEQPNVEYYRIC
ncbi:uncharacterized protein LOC113332878 [Papaver somniferum]|uniref:uncharacterized protein LOC113332878 n=1 Tax=Papaver somniferum TaxID=3469 RepID=UPI000E6F9733|nr:uncharacterized protein LOC113332878 [Papaver somniferum]